MTWRFIDSGQARGCRHMAVDEALLEACARGQTIPILRVFAFAPPCLSLGRFQPAADIDPAEGGRLGIEVVRRPTGGRAVLHAGDLCYSVIAPIDDPRVGGSIGQSYGRIAAALQRSLELLGAWPDPRPSSAGPASAEHGRLNGPCFALAAPFEFTVGGAKVIGSAQVRRNGALLQQGSIRLTADPDLESRLLRASNGGSPGLCHLLGRWITRQEMARALRRGFAQALDVSWVGATLSEEEAMRARLLEREKYANPAWTWSQPATPVGQH